MNLGESDLRTRVLRTLTRLTGEDWPEITLDELAGVYGSLEQAEAVLDDLAAMADGDGWQRIRAGRPRRCGRCDRRIDPGEECHVWRLGTPDECTRCDRRACRPASADEEDEG